MELIDCVVSENCQNICKACNDCEYYSHYWPIKTGNRKHWSPRQKEEADRKKQEKKEKKNSDASKRGKAAKRKGYRTEKKIADILGGERVPLSGALRGKYSNDVQAHGWQFEVKARKDGWKEIRRWVHDKVENPDAVVLVPDREEPLVVMTLTMFKNYMKERY